MTGDTLPPSARRTDRRMSPSGGWLAAGIGLLLLFPLSSPDEYFLDNGMRDWDFNGDGFTNVNDRFSTNYNTVKGGLQYTFQCLFDKPLAVFVEELRKAALNSA